jgi:hypothetical protein
LLDRRNPRENTAQALREFKKRGFELSIPIKTFFKTPVETPGLFYFLNRRRFVTNKTNDMGINSRDTPCRRLLRLIARVIATQLLKSQVTENGENSGNGPPEELEGNCDEK